MRKKIILFFIFLYPNLGFTQNLTGYGITGVYFGMSTSDLIATRALVQNRTDSLIEVEGKLSKDTKYFLEKNTVAFKNLSYAIEYLFINDKLYRINISYANCLDFENILFQLKKEFKKIKSKGIEFSDNFERLVKKKYTGKSNNIQMMSILNYKLGVQNVYLYSPKFNYLLTKN